MQPVAAPQQNANAVSDGWGEAWADPDDESAADEETADVESERQRRAEAERERDELRETASSLSRQVRDRALGDFVEIPDQI